MRKCLVLAALVAAPVLAVVTCPPGHDAQPSNETVVYNYRKDNR
jgi:hypothetical protein